MISFPSTHGPFVLALALAASPDLGAEVTSPPADRELAREIFKELVEIDTTHSTGSTHEGRGGDGRAARERRAPRRRTCRCSGRRPRKGNLVARLRGTGDAAGRSCCSRISTSSRPDARTGRSIPSCSARRTATSTAAARATTRRWPRSSSRTCPLHARGLPARPRRVLALTADEEGGRYNGVDWLLQNHRASSTPSSA